MKSFEWLLAWRYTRGSHKDGFISFISIMSMLGVMAGVALLIIVLSVMNGFQREVRERMLSVIPHVQVYPQPDVAEGWEAPLTESIKKNPEVLGVAPYMTSQSIILHDSEMIGVKVEGIDPALEASVSEVPKKIIAGQGDLNDLRAGEFNIVVGVELARRLGLEIAPDQFVLGEQITLLAPEVDSTIAGTLPRMRQFNVVGIISAGHFEIDNAYVYLNVNDAKALYRDGNRGLRVKLKDMEEATVVAREIKKAAPMRVFAQDWSSINPAWFSAVKTEKTMMTIILLCIVIVAAFNLVSMLVMTVNEKKADIAILRTQGSSRMSIMRVFMTQGALIGGMGTLLGVGLGVLVAVNIGSIVHGVEALFNIEVLPKGVYFISTMPSQVRPNEVIVIAIASFCLSLLATIYPSRKAANVEPARALRYE